jgi:Ca-activated chloride channel homolog
MYLAEPLYLLLLLLLPLGLLRRRAAVKFAAGRFLGAGLPASWRVRLRFLPRVALVLGMVFLVVALSRPVKRVPLPATTEGIDIFLCLDLSSSMAQTDMDPERTRLDVAREAALEFVAGRKDDRIGLVTFARFADLSCPLTLDHDALLTILGAVSLVEGDGPEDATGIGSAVALAARALEDGAGRSKVVILLTDGEENVARTAEPGEIPPMHAAQLCGRLGIRVYSIVAGLGSRDSGGQWVPLDTAQVFDLAKRTGGRFFTARDAPAAADVYREIDRLEKAEIEEPRFEIVERFLPFLLVGLALLLVGRLLATTRLRVFP